ncbi:MAG: conjugative transposon protein TraN [Bacteroidetes bacterium]|nr:conjugative transposon protein TraN [Bacteroidota bacterium]
MKQLVCLIFGCWMFACLPARQVSAQVSSLVIATDKTTSLIFPFPILHVDRGTKDILVQQVKEADNILLVKAAAQKFSETNLSVVTNDGSVYTFRVSYSKDPSVWVWHIPVQNETTLSIYCNGILDNKRTMRGISDHSWDMLATVVGIYIKGNVMYYQLKLENRSPINYDVELLKFYIRDKKKGKRTATQENELTPLYVAGNTSQVKANCNNTIVVALDKFTIPDKKYLAIQILEKNGGRHLLMRIQNNKILKAILLPDLK